MHSNNELFNLESIIFNYIDEFKFLFFPDQWSNVFLDYSKNEILSLLFLYRYKKANMTEIAEYINAPLNTATGVISRLEKKEMAARIRDEKDRRVVNIVLTKKAEDFIKEEKKLIEHYFKEIHSSLTQEEKESFISIINKVMVVFKAEKDKANNPDKKSKKIKRIEIE